MGPSSRWTLPQYHYGLSCSCSLHLSCLSQLSFSRELTSPCIFLTSCAHQSWTGFNTWSPLICFPAHVLCFCLCSTSLACRVCVLTFQGLGVDYSMLLEPRVLQK